MKLRGSRRVSVPRTMAVAFVVSIAVLATVGALAQDGGRRDAGPAQVRDAGTSVSEAETPPREAAAARIRQLRERAPQTPLWQRAVSLFGLAALIGLAWVFSSNRRIVPWRIVAGGTVLQLLFGTFVLKTSAGLWLFSVLNDAVERLLDFTKDGARFLFGDYLDMRFSFALNVLPTIIFFSSMMAVLYHAGVMQRVVNGFAWVMQRTMRTSGAETLSTAANIFLGQTEAPLVVKPYVDKMTESELYAVLLGGFANTAGGVLAAYVGMLHDYFPDIAGHLIACSVMSAPATLVIAKVMLPETGTPETADTLGQRVEKIDANMLDAAARGASEGMQLAINVAAMLLAFLALVALVNYVIALPALWHDRAVWHDVVAALGRVHHPVPACGDTNDADALATCIERAVREGGLRAADYSAWHPITMQRVFGWIFWPIAFVMGTPPQDCATVASLLGEKTVLNEFVAYLHLAEKLRNGEPISYRAVVIASYALCGFANFGSVAIQIGGIGGMAPSRRADLARLGLRAMFGGMLATCMTACVAGVLV